MEAKRANEIIKTTKEVEVHYNNNPVWIKRVDVEASIARVKFLGSSEEIDVPVSKLHEI
jgi:small acid-soluble spore protein H (minor)